VFGGGKGRTNRSVRAVGVDCTVKADVFDYIERFYNPRQRLSTIGYLSPIEFEELASLAQDGNLCHRENQNSTATPNAPLSRPDGCRRLPASKPSARAVTARPTSITRSSSCKGAGGMCAALKAP
jgi:hypothetical protein